MISEIPYGVLRDAWEAADAVDKFDLHSDDDASSAAFMRLVETERATAEALTYAILRELARSPGPTAIYWLLKGYEDANANA